MTNTNNKESTILNIISNIGGLVQVTDLYAKAASVGISQEDVDQVIKKLSDSGQITMGTPFTNDKKKLDVPTGTSFVEWATICHRDDFTLLKELLAYDAVCLEPGSLQRHISGSLQTKYDPVPLHWSRQVEYPWVLKNGHFDNSHRCLDVGMGSVFKFAISHRCGSLVCLDNNPQAINESESHLSFASSVFPGLYGNITHVLASAESLPYPDNYFDRVLCVSVIEHIASDDARDKAFSEMIRVLRPGGWLLVTMDVVTKSLSNSRGDFHVTIPKAEKVCNLFGMSLPSFGSNTQTCSFPKEGVSISVIMIRYIKP